MIVQYEIREITQNARVLVLRGSINTGISNNVKFVQMLHTFFPLESFSRSFWVEETSVKFVGFNGNKFDK